MESERSAARGAGSSMDASARRAGQLVGHRQRSKLLAARWRRRRGIMIEARPLGTMDRDFLEEMLFEAFFWNPAWSRPRRAEVREQAGVTEVPADWGRSGDPGGVGYQQRARSWEA